MKLRSFGILILLLLFAIGCTSASKSFKKGRYDDAIAKCIKVLYKEPSNQKHLDILRDAYRVADANDKERILALKQGGQPDVWGSIVTIYERMIARNKKIDVLPSSVKNEINFAYQSHSEDLALAKQKATEYHYAAGVQKLNVGTKIEARRAFADFEKVIFYSGANYKDVRELKAYAEDLGTTYVLLRLSNSSGAFLPPEAVYNLTNINPESMNKKWVRYEAETRREYYQYEVTLSLDRIILFPITVNTKQLTETKTITDGTEYLTDSKGKPVLDSLGNFIKVPRKVTLACTIREIIQQKTMRLDGSLTYFDVENRRMVRTILMTGSAVAHSTAFHTSGDLRALSDYSRRRITAPFIPLPPDEAMVILASQNLSEQMRIALNEHAGLIK